MVRAFLSPFLALALFEAAAASGCLAARTELPLLGDETGDVAGDVDQSESLVETGNRPDIEAGRDSFYMEGVPWWGVILIVIGWDMTFAAWMAFWRQRERKRRYLAIVREQQCTPKP